jgi:hypothetical protein
MSKLQYADIKFTYEKLEGYFVFCQVIGIFKKHKKLSDNSCFCKFYIHWLLLFSKYGGGSNLK